MTDNRSILIIGFVLLLVLAILWLGGQNKAQGIEIDTENTSNNSNLIATEAAKLMLKSFNGTLGTSDFATLETLTSSNKDYADLVDEAEFLSGIGNQEHAAHTLGSLHIFILSGNYTSCAWHDLQHISDAAENGRKDIASRKVSRTVSELVAWLEEAKVNPELHPGINVTETEVVINSVIKRLTSENYSFSQEERDYLELRGVC